MDWFWESHNFCVLDSKFDYRRPLGVKGWNWWGSRENFGLWKSVWSPDSDLAAVTVLGFAVVAAVGVEWWSDFYAPLCRPAERELLD